MQRSTQLDTATTATGTTRLPDSLCTHTPKCPSADSPDREAAIVVAAHPEQGWSLLCNAVLLFEAGARCRFRARPACRPSRRRPARPNAAGR